MIAKPSQSSSKASAVRKPSARTSTSPVADAEIKSEPAGSPPQSADDRESMSQWARTTLNTMREQIEADLRALASPANDAEQACGDEADIAAIRAEHEARFTTQAALTKRLGQVESALVRLRRGEYGICEITGEEIPIERLRANPLATRTIEAQERAERRSRLFAV